MSENGEKYALIVKTLSLLNLIKLKIILLVENVLILSVVSAGFLKTIALFGLFAQQVNITS
jgi:hypothetical protein